MFRRAICSGCDQPPTAKDKPLAVGMTAMPNADHERSLEKQSITASGAACCRVSLVLWDAPSWFCVATHDAVLSSR
jgi:hypothetical protein